jgi:hypothetical protein
MISTSVCLQVEEARAPIQVLPPRLKSLQDYLGQVRSESDQWKDLHQSRKNRQVCFSGNNSKGAKSFRQHRKRSRLPCLKRHLNKCIYIFVQVDKMAGHRFNGL